MSGFPSRRGVYYIESRPEGPFLWVRYRARGEPQKKKYGRALVPLFKELNLDFRKHLNAKNVERAVDLVKAALDEEGLERFAEARNSLDLYSEELEFMGTQGVTPIGIHEPGYPHRLHRLSDPPAIVYLRGELPPEDRTAVAVVGSHHADAEGIGEAVAWGRGFAERDVVVVSGLARGIDGGAHTGALAGNGKTIAVLGSGFKNIYPPEHQTLSEEIAENGALLTEYPPDASLTKPRLLYRNRLIVALADAVVVVRISDTTGGSIETLKRAHDLACPAFLVAADTGQAAQRAVANGAVPIASDPDFDLVLNYL